MSGLREIVVLGKRHQSNINISNFKRVCKSIVEFAWLSKSN